MTFSALVALSLVGSPAELKDPRTRDEDISATRVDVHYELRGDGLYEYVYTVRAPVENLGYVNTFTVDLTCTNEVPGTVPPPPSARQGYLGDHSDDGNHPPATVSADYGQAGIYGISSENEAQWAVWLRPGEQATGLRIVSPALPGIRTYKLIPYMDNDPSWAYPEEPDPGIPWIDDFTVTGAIAGPGCPDLTQPVEDPLFAGSGNSRTEPGTVNLLLAYKTPMRDRISLAPSTKSARIEIVYSDDIDPKTFKVQPVQLRSFFDPQPGTSQTVDLPLNSTKQTMRFEVHRRPVEDASNAGLNNPSHDLDVFEIRRR